MNNFLVIETNNNGLLPFAESISFIQGQKLSQAIYLAGSISPPPLCSGLGACGHCLVQFISPPPAPTIKEQEILSPLQIDTGFRLSCQHLAMQHMHVRLPEAVQAYPTVPLTQPSFPQKASSSHLLAVDLGTTSLHWALGSISSHQHQHGNLQNKEQEYPQDYQLSTQRSETIEWQETSEINPQMGAGSDIISRLAYADSSQTLQRLTLNRIEFALANAPTLCQKICLAANTALTYLTLGLETKGLAHAPYSLPYAGGNYFNLPHLPPLWIPPLLAPFVGGDISAGYAAIQHQFPHAQYPFVFADLGTNGEIILALSPQLALVTSVALGPALEGVGLRFGSATSRHSTINHFSLSPQKLEAHLTNSTLSANELPLAGISASGYLSLLDILIKCGAMNSKGELHPQRSPLLQRFIKQNSRCMCPHCQSTLPAQMPIHMQAIPLPHNFFITSQDIEEILKAKAAFSLGLVLLLEKAHITTQQIRTVYLAGALGSSITGNLLENLGFFPQGMAKRIISVGNSSLSGAKLLAASSTARKNIVAWAQHVHPLDLSAHPQFMQRYLEHMQFAWRQSSS